MKTRTSEEKVWLILVHLFENEDIIYSPENIARLCFEAGFTDAKLLQSIFIEDILPACFLPAFFDMYNLPFDEEPTIAAIHKYKQSVIPKAIMKFILLFSPKDDIYKFFGKMELEMYKLKNC